MMTGFVRAASVAVLISGAVPVPAHAQTADTYGDMAPVPSSEADYGTTMPGGGESGGAVVPAPAPAPAAPAPAAPATPTVTYQKNDVLSAAEGVFGSGAEDLAKLLERILKDQGEPNAYIAGREAGAAIAIGVRYGSGTLSHKVEGQRPVYWTGPSLGFDLGANGSKTFVLVYNLYDSQELFKRFPAAEGAAYVVGGFTASYLRRGDVVLVPIRLGVGWRLGVNVGYMKFTEKSQLLPF